MEKPRIAITIGDPAGIGPEVVLKSLIDKEVLAICKPTIIGSARVFKLYYPRLFSQLKNIDIIDIPLETSIVLGKVQTGSGKSAYDYIHKSVELVTAGQVNALVTAPISKEAIQKAGYNFSGHTEMLAKLTNSKQVVMCMLNKELKTIQVTRHIPLTRVSRELTKKNLVTTIRLGRKAMRELFKIRHPRIVVCALNPHAGENGILGDEEKNVIIPSIKMLRRRNITIDGPYPADSVFQPAKRKKYDLVVGLYHDQVMIPLKAIDPYSIVNLTIGLPFIRTSPGHGTAFDITGKNIANPQPMKEAIKLAAKLTMGGQVHPYA